MGGFFLDDVIRILIRFLLRLFRVWRARRWCSAAGTIVRAVAAQVDDGWAPLVFYSFAVNSREYFGDLHGTPVEAEEARKLASGIQPGGQIVVRFAPKDPTRTVALNDDNREGLPFKIAE